MSLLQLLKEDKPNWRKVIARLAAKDIFDDASEIEEDTTLTALHLLMIKRRAPGLTHTTCKLLTAKLLAAFPECAFVWEEQTGLNAFHYLSLPLEEDEEGIEKDAELMEMFIRSDKRIINEPTETGETPLMLHVGAFSSFAKEDDSFDRQVSTRALAHLLPKKAQYQTVSKVPVSTLVEILG